MLKKENPHSPEWFQERYTYDPDTGKVTLNFTGQAIGSHCKLGYLLARVGDSTYRVHRIAWAIQTGEWPYQVDHINHDRTDNRWVNLRECTANENHKNKSMQKNNTTGVTGVRWHSQSKKWMANITVRSRYIHLGCFEQKEDAIKARKQAEEEFNFHPNHGTKQEEI